MSRHRGSDLHPQALRLPQRARASLFALAESLHTAGCDVTAGEAMRGLFLLALKLAGGSAGVTAADVFRLVARDPSAPCLRSALESFLWLLDIEPHATPKFSSAPATTRAEERKTASKRCRSLHSQALRLPKHVQVELESLAAELWLPGALVTVAHATRGLSLLAVEIVRGAAGPELADAFRLAASDPTVEGARRALRAVRLFLEGLPATIPDAPDDAPTTTPTPPWFDDDGTTSDSGSSPSSQTLTPRAA